MPHMSADVSLPGQAGSCIVGRANQKKELPGERGGCWNIRTWEDLVPVGSRDCSSGCSNLGLRSIARGFSGLYGGEGSLQGSTEAGRHRVPGNDCSFQMWRVKEDME